MDLDVPTGKKILVTGACGSVGSQLIRFLASKNSLFGFDLNENGVFEQNMVWSKSRNVNFFVGDVADIHQLKKYCRDIDIIYHLAALKHVGSSELNIDIVLRTNVQGTLNVIRCCRDFGVKKMVFTSSDKAVNPSNAMGASKLMGEKAVLSEASMSTDTDFSIIRFGNVIGSSGSVLPIFEKQISERRPITLTDTRMTRFMVTMPEVMRLCVNSLHQKNGTLTIREMPSVKIEVLAKAMLSFFNKKIPIEVVGARPGEKLYEEILTEVEANNTFVKDGTLIVDPDSRNNGNPYTFIKSSEVPTLNLKETIQFLRKHYA